MRLSLFFILAWLTTHAMAQGHAPVIVAEDFQTLALGRSIEIWEDKNNLARIDDILQRADLQQQFMLSQDEIPRGALSQSTYWVRFTIRNVSHESRTLYLEFQNPVVDRVELFQLETKGYKAYPAQGDQQPFKDRLRTDSPAFILHLPPGDTSFYLSYKSNGNAYLLPLFLWKPEAFIQKAVLQLTFNAAVLGSLLALGFYNIFLSFKLRLRMYFYYVCYIFITIFAVANTNGFLKIFLFPDAGAWKLFDEGYPVSTNLSGTFIALFAVQFLDLHQHQPTLARILRVIAASLALTSILIWFHKTSGVLISLPLGLILFCVLIITAIRSVLQGFRPARIYLVAWSMLIGSAIIWLLALSGIGLTTEQSMWLLRGSIVMETILIAIAIGEKLRLEQRAAQQRIEAQVQQIQGLNTELRKKEAARTAFFNNTSHELRTPLNGIMGFLDLLLRGQYGVMPPDAGQILNKVKSLSASLKMQVNDILELAKGQKGQQQAHYSRFSISDLVDEMTVLAEGLALKAKATTFEVKLQDRDNVGATFVSDYEKLQASVRNLISNAFKFRKRDTPNHIVIQFAVSREELRVTVRDQGIGLRPEDFQHIFDEFAQVEQDSRRSYEGTGLGLALVAQYMKLLQGEIKLESEPGLGSCFILVVPNALDHGSDIAAVKDRVLVDEESLATEFETDSTEFPSPIPLRALEGSGKILIVDDNAANGEIFSAILQSSGYRILYVMSGKEALEVMPSFQPDLILLDMMMPEFSGDDVLRSLRQHAEFRKTPVIVVTARAHDDDRIQALKAGADEYLPKPIVPEELLLRVENVLARHTLVKEMVQKAIIRGELDAARQVQQALVENQQSIPGLQFSSYYKPAVESGGDWFCAIHEPGTSRVFFFIGDVTGHGLSSALLTGVVHGAINGIFHYAALKNQNLSLEEFMIQLVQATDRTLLDLATRTDRWMTMAFVGLDMATGQGVLVNAGHQTIYHIRDRKPRPLVTIGSPLGTGFVENPKILNFDFKNNDRLFLYTDGLLELGDDKRPARRQKHLEELLASAEDGDELLREILEHSKVPDDGHQLDDVSMLHVRRVA